MSKEIEDIGNILVGGVGYDLLKVSARETFQKIRTTVSNQIELVKRQLFFLGAGIDYQPFAAALSKEVSPFLDGGNYELESPNRVDQLEILSRGLLEEEAEIMQLWARLYAGSFFERREFLRAVVHGLKMLNHFDAEIFGRIYDVSFGEIPEKLMGASKLDSEKYTVFSMDGWMEFVGNDRPFTSKDMVQISVHSIFRAGFVDSRFYMNNKGGQLDSFTLSPLGAEAGKYLMEVAE